mmetsp:Transcript_73345/g.119034  ORF Transcript_73345/g.119034 Transcript_73345/m.119034 type:complete len:108 (+) Transcript_73345:133-456(+)
MSGRGVCTCATQDVEVVSGCLVETCVHVRHKTLRWCVHVRHETSRWCVHYDTSHVRHKSCTQDHLRYKTLRSCVDVRHETSRWCADVERQDIYTGPGATCGHGDIFA